MATEFALETQASKYATLDAIIDLVLGCHSTEELCTRLVHDDFTRGIIRGAHIYTINKDMDMFLEVGYGKSSEQAKTSISAWEDSPVSQGLLTKKQVFTSGAEESLLVVPLLRNRVPVACLLLVMAASVEASPLTTETFQVMAKIGGFFVETKPTRIRQAGERRNVTFDQHLGARQIAILEYISEGLTNGQIGRNLSISESTVRQETIKIYKSLEIKGRADAVAKARAIGLIKA